MTGVPQPDPNLEHTLRRVADHLMRQGSQYRERPLQASPESLEATRPSGRAGLWALVATVAAVIVGGTLVAQSTSQSASRPRLQAAVDRSSSTTVEGVDTSIGDEAVPSSSLVVPEDGSERALEPGVSEPTFLPPDVTDPSISLPGFPVGPTISDVVVPPTVAAGSSVTFTWRVADSDSVSATGVVIGWVNGIYTPCGFGDEGTLVGGSRADGEWSYTCWFPSDAVATTYSVDVWASDGLGNSSRVSGFEFQLEGGNADSSAPAYSDVRVVSGARVGDVLTVTWSLTDPSGIQGAVMWIGGGTGGFTNLVTGRTYAMYDTMVVTRDCNVPGDSCDYTQSLQIDPSSPPGTYALWLSATDTLGNKVLGEVLRFTLS